MPDQETPTARPVQRRVDEAAADAGTLADMGVIEEQPIPTPSIAPFLEPSFPPPEEPAGPEDPS
jgi:hypothetical protein